MVVRRNWYSGWATANNLNPLTFQPRHTARHIALVGHGMQGGWVSDTSCRVWRPGVLARVLGRPLGCYMVKPHGPLVRVSSTPCGASTSRLSTSSSSRVLQGACAPGTSHLEGGFPLRCFQRLSHPHLATGQCHGHDNPNTSGASTPVLSY